MIKYWLMFFITVFTIPVYVVSVGVNLFGLFGKLPSFEVLEKPNTNEASELYSSDGVLLGKYFRYNKKDVPYSLLSKNVVNALIATEDYEFFEHSGISLYGLLRAGIYSIILRRKAGGGSTLTQQLAKFLFQTRGQCYDGVLVRIPVLRMLIIKTKEWVTAIKLERMYSKEEIIAMYLNNVCFGNNAYGIDAASRTYFGIDQSELSYDQAALLISVLRGPSYYNPVKNTDRAKSRRDNVILFNLMNHGYITKNDYDNYTSKEIDIKLHKNDDYNSGIAPYFRANIKKYLINWGKQHGYDIFSDGLRIFTTLDSRMQKYAEEAVFEHMKNLQNKFEKHIGESNPWIDEDGNEIDGFIEKIIPTTDTYRELIDKYGKDEALRYIYIPRKTKLFSWNGDVEVEISPYDEIKYNQKILHAGMISIDPYSGFVKTWVGGINYDHFKFDHVKQGKRQCGSTFKPFIYATALECGMSPDDIVYDLPTTFDMGPNLPPWTPKNSNNVYTGEAMTLRQALSRSVNSIAASLVKTYSPKLICEYAHKLGISSQISAVPSICFGSSDVSVMELTSAYCPFVNQGIWTQPICITRIEDKYGRVIAKFIPDKHEAISKKTASEMLYMLRGAAEEKKGTFAGLSIELKKDNKIGGKTGTTSNQSDGWTVGVINKLCVGVWVGGDNRCIHFRNLSLGQGAAMARPIFEKFLLKLYADKSLGYKKENFIYG